MEIHSIDTDSSIKLVKVAKVAIYSRNSEREKVVRHNRDAVVVNSDSATQRRLMIFQSTLSRSLGVY